MTTSKRLTKTQKERAEIFAAVEKIMTGERELMPKERDQIMKLQSEMGTERGILRFVLDERDEAENDG